VLGDVVNGHVPTVHGWIQLALSPSRVESAVLGGDGGFGDVPVRFSCLVVTGVRVSSRTRAELAATS